MSEKQLVAYTHVRDVGGCTVAYGPGDDVPAWARKQITNPKAWGDVEPAATPQAETTSPAGTGDALEAPPRTGKGSGVEAWRDFAARKGVDVDQDATREQIIAASEAAGVVEREE